MMFIQEILDWATARGYKAMYGDPAQINDYMTDVQFSTSQDGIAVYCHLIRNAETVNWHDRADVAVYFAKLCDFDFNPTALLPVQEQLKNAGKSLLYDLIHGNTVQVLTDARWQFGYDDYAENVAWCCMRVTLEDAAMDCMEDYKPITGGYWTAKDNGLSVPFSNIVSTNGTLEDDGYKLVFENMDDAELVIEKTESLVIRVFHDGVNTPIPLVDNTYTVSGFPSGAVVVYDWGVI